MSQMTQALTEAVQEEQRRGLANAVITIVTFFFEGVSWQSKRCKGRSTGFDDGMKEFCEHVKKFGNVLIHRSVGAL